MSTVKCSAEVRDDEQLAVDRALVEFVVNLPTGALLSPIMIDKGSQRDPWPVLVGLRAAWEEER